MGVEELEAQDHVASARQIQAVTTGDGRWKLQFPHTYVTLDGKPGGTNGVPVSYSQRKVEHEELYDLVNDISETTDVSAQHLEVMQRLEADAAAARADLGDGLTKQNGANRRQPGHLAENKPAQPTQ